MTVTSTNQKVSFSGNGSTTVFAYNFKIFAETDLLVILRSSTGTETTQNLTSNYTVSGVGVTSGGNVTMGTAPASGTTLVIQRVQPQLQGLDLVPNDPFPAQSMEDALDKLVFNVQTLNEEVGRAIKASTTNTINGTEFTISATDRANKLFSFDSSGDLNIAQELGTFKGDWAASTTYAVRDLVKDTSTNNIFICITAHTSSGSQPLTTNTDSAKWSLIVDAASATTSQTAAATSATAAASSATAAASSATAAASSATDAAGSSGASGAATSATAAASSATAAASSATSAASSLSTFQSQYHGAASSDPSSNLSTGDLYFNTSSNTLKVYNGSAWVAAAFDTSGALLAANNLSDVASAATALTNLGVTSTAAELNQLDGKVAKTAGLETIWIPAAAMYPSTTNGCSALTQVETTALRPDMKVLDFAADADDFAQFSIAFPKSWNEGTVKFQVFWTPSTTNTGNCIWGLQGVSVADGATIDVAFGTAVTVTDAGIGTVEDQQVSPLSGEVTLTNAAVDTQSYFQIFRDANAGGDTFTGVSRLLGIKLFFTTDAANDA